MPGTRPPPGASLPTAAAHRHRDRLRSTACGKAAVIHVDVDPKMHLYAPGLEEFKAMHREPGE